MQYCKDCGAEIGEFTGHGLFTRCETCRIIHKKKLQKEYKARCKALGIKRKYNPKSENLSKYSRCGRCSRYGEGMAATIEDYAIGGSCHRVILKTVTRTFNR